MSIKMYGLIPRKPGMTTQEFHDYYRHPHGTMGSTMTTMRGYVQNHQIYTEKLGPDQARYDAIAEIWLDNERDAVEFREEPNLVKYLIEDEPKFTDFPNVNFFAADAEVLISGPAQNSGLHPGDELWSPRTRPFSVKLMVFVETDGNADWSRADDEEVGKALNAFRQSRATPVRAMHGDSPTFLGLHEFWWPTQTMFERAVDKSPDALKEIEMRAGKSFTTLVQAERYI